MTDFLRPLQGVVLMLGLPSALFHEVPMPQPKTSYVYSPGLGGSPIVIGRYCHRYEAYTGEVIKGTRGGNIFGDGTRISTVIFPEIDTLRPLSGFRATVGPGVARLVFKHRFGIEVDEKPESAETIFNYIFDFKAVNIGQKNDITSLRNVFKQHITRFGLESGRVVMFGDSRGAATTFNFIAEEHPKIACAIVEGIFDSLPHVIQHLICDNKWGWVEDMFTNMLNGLAGDYSHEGPFPLNYVQNFPYDTPLLMVTSLKDEVVPYQCTMNLYCNLLAAGHSNVRLLILPRARHDRYMIYPDKERYESCIHAFYRSCGVDYDPVLADKGESVLAETRPTLDEIHSKYLSCHK